MFTSLNDEFKRADGTARSPNERRLFYVVVLLVSLILFSGLYAGIRYLE